MYAMKYSINIQFNSGHCHLTPVVKKKHKKQSSSSHNIIIGVKQLEFACGKSRLQLYKVSSECKRKKTLQGHGQRIVDEEEKMCARKHFFA